MERRRGDCGDDHDESEDDCRSYQCRADTGVEEDRRRDGRTHQQNVQDQPDAGRADELDDTVC